MDIEERLRLIKEVGEEIVTEQELREILQTKTHPVAYDGFEPSGNMHIAQGIFRAINVNKMTKAGVRFKMLVADWHAWANNKLGGNLENIQAAGDYFIEVWRASGMDLKNIQFIRSSDMVDDQEYWKKVIRIARENTVARATRCAQIMGRTEKDSLSAAQIIYPCMQAADVFHLGADITQLGMDQRKVNMLAREIGPQLGFWKPVVISHHMMPGLAKPPENASSAEERAMAFKMSKSKPDSAIFMTDSAEEVKKKIAKAYCPEKVAEDNPIMEYCRYMVFERFKAMEIDRPAKFGGSLAISSYGELEKLYRSGQLHPMDLKNATAFYINEMIKPVREHFRTDAKARKLLEQVKCFEVTR
jgi:tyrosyl-tRNA synthetase